MGINRWKELGVLPVLSKQEPSSILTLESISIPAFLALLAEQTGRQKSSPSPESSLFIKPGKFHPLQMANLNQIENLGQKHAMTGERVHDRSWLGLPASLEKSKQLRCLNPQPEPLIEFAFIVPGIALLWFPYITYRAGLSSPVEREASQCKRAGTAFSLIDSSPYAAISHGGPGVRTRDRTWDEQGTISTVPEGA